MDHGSILVSKVSFIKNSFNSGEWSPNMYGRTDIGKYNNALKVCENMIPLVQGGCIKRPGTDYIAEIKDSNAKARAISFVFSTTQAYGIEIGNLYARFYKDDAQIQYDVLSGVTGSITSGTPTLTVNNSDSLSIGNTITIAGVNGNKVIIGKAGVVLTLDSNADATVSSAAIAFVPGAYEITTPFSTSILFDLRSTQSADVMFICHPSLKPRELTRTGHANWQIKEFVNTDGPYLDINPDLTNTMTPSGITGTITLNTVKKTFVTTDVGRLVRFRDSASNWTWLEITAYSNDTTVTATVKGANLATTTASNAWRLGLWSETTGYPSTVEFHENRLCFSGPTDNPFRVDLSSSGNYWNFSPTDPYGTVTDSHAFNFTLLAREVNSIRWMASDEKGLICGTVGAEWIASPSTLNAAMTPTSVKVVQASNRGSGTSNATKVAKAILFMQKTRKKMREFAFVANVDGFDAQDMTVLSDHITGDGISEIAYQQEPATVVWAVRDDGQLIGLTYDRLHDAIGWHRHIIGGNGVVESATVIPDNPNGFDELFVIVKRTINGVTKRYIEDLDNFWSFQANGLIEDSVFVDSAIKYSGASTSVLTGLSHLEGETVSILGDGVEQESKVVSGGQITLDTAVTKATVGLTYNSVIETLEPDSGAQDGTSMSKSKRITHVGAKLYRSKNISFGPSSDKMQKTTHSSLFSGDILVNWPKGYDNDATVRVEHNDPTPLSLTFLSIYMNTYDR